MTECSVLSRPDPPPHLTGGPPNRPRRVPSLERFLTTAAAALLLSVLAGPRDVSAELPGLRELRISQLAPPFALHPLGGGPAVSSRDVFAARSLTLLILWDSNCPDCMRAVADCRRIHQQSDSLGVTVLSINFDQGNLAQVRAFVKAEEIAFPVLMDPGARVAAQYGADPYSFTFLIVNAGGLIRYVCYDRPPEVLELIQGQLGVLAQDLALHEHPIQPADSLGTDVPDSSVSGGR